MCVVRGGDGGGNVGASADAKDGVLPSLPSSAPTQILHHCTRNSSLEVNDDLGASFKDSKNGDKRAAQGGAAAAVLRLRL